MESLVREAPLADVELWPMGKLCVALVTPFELMPVGVVLSPPCWLVVTLALMPMLLKNARLRMAVTNLAWSMEPSLLKRLRFMPFSLSNLLCQICSRLKRPGSVCVRVAVETVLFLLLLQKLQKIADTFYTF